MTIGIVIFKAIDNSLCRVIRNFDRYLGAIAGGGARLGVLAIGLGLTSCCRTLRAHIFNARLYPHLLVRGRWRPSEVFAGAHEIDTIQKSHERDNVALGFAPAAKENIFGEV